MIRKIASVLFGILLALLVIELGSRLAGFVIISYRDHSNRQKMQDRGNYRILCVGESTTAFGYPPVLEKELNKRSNGIKFSVIDKGVPATDTTAILANLGSYLDEYKPDMVIAMMGINDAPREYCSSSEKTLLQRLKVYRLFQLQKLHIMAKAARAKEMTEPGEREDTKNKISEASFYKIIEKYYRDIRVTENPPSGTGCQKTYKSMQRSVNEKRVIVLLDMIHENPRDIRAYRELACVYRELAMHDEAAAVFEKCISLNAQQDVPDDIYYKLFALHMDLCQKGEACKIIGELIKERHRGPLIGIMLADMLDDRGQPDQAIAVLEMTIKCFHDDRCREVVAHLGNLYIQHDQEEKARRLFGRCQKANREREHFLAMLKLHYFNKGKFDVAERYSRELEEFQMRYYNPVTCANYLQLIQESSARGVTVTCMQYPMRSIKPLKEMLPQRDDLVFVDNEKVFEDAVKDSCYDEYFRDRFAADFGHCTDKGNLLMANNIIHAIAGKVHLRKGERI